MMSDQSIDEGYFGYLYHLTKAPSHRDPRRSYFSLLAQLHIKPFYWFVHNDDNRETDGKELRNEFLSEHDVSEPDQPWDEVPASVLEVLIGLARRLSFESYGEPAQWFWVLLQNLGIDRYVDAVYQDDIAEDVERVLNLLLSREYGRDGTGGLFPLRTTSSDQRRVEIWYQMSAYLLEGNVID
jgi:hypothetical protein